MSYQERKINNRKKYRAICFFCKYEIIKGRVKILNYKNTSIKVCSGCKSDKIKACSLKYKSTFVDCSICGKVVKDNNCILCTNCDHFTHQKCTLLSSKDIKDIEKLQTGWFCNNCNLNIFPFSPMCLQTSNKNNKKQKIVGGQANLLLPGKININQGGIDQCFACKNTIFLELMF